MHLFSNLLKLLLKIVNILIYIKSSPHQKILILFISLYLLLFHLVIISSSLIAQLITVTMNVKTHFVLLHIQMDILNLVNVKVLTS